MMKGLPRNFQDTLLTGLIWNTRVARRVVNTVPIDLWDQGRQSDVALIYPYVRKHDRAPKDHIADLWETRNDKDHRRRSQLMVSTADAIERYNVQFVIDRLTAFTRAQRVRQVIIEAAPMLNEPDVPVGRIIRLLREVTEEDPAGDDFKVISATDLTTMPLPPKEYILRPVLMAKSSNFIHAWRGRGKSFFAMAIAWSAATGTPLLGWTPPKRRRTLIIDGELPLQDLRDRVEAFNRRFGDPGGRVRFFSYDAQRRGMPDLGSEEGVRQFERVINAFDPDLVILDNIDTLKRSGDPKEATDWQIVRGLELRQRAAGRCIIFVAHHSKQDRLAGSHTMESICEESFGLYEAQGEPPEDETLRFELRLEKHRRLSEQEAKPFIVEVRMERRRRKDGSEYTRMGKWRKKSLASSIEEQVRDLLDKNYTIADIGKELGKSESTIRHHVRSLETQGLIPKEDRRGRGAKLRNRQSGTL